jgi:hypothetical protein
MRSSPDAASTDYARYEDTAVYEHAVAFNNAYAELLAHLKIAFNGMPPFMILVVPTMLHLRDLAELLYHNPHPDPDKGPRGYFASATFEIDHHQIEHSHKTVSAKIRTARLNTEEPVDLSRVEPKVSLSFTTAQRPLPVQPSHPEQPVDPSRHRMALPS